MNVTHTCTHTHAYTHVHTHTLSILLSGGGGWGGEGDKGERRQERKKLHQFSFSLLRLSSREQTGFVRRLTSFIATKSLKGQSQQRAWQYPIIILRQHNQAATGCMRKISVHSAWYLWDPEVMCQKRNKDVRKVYCHETSTQKNGQPFRNYIR